MPLVPPLDEEQFNQRVRAADADVRAYTEAPQASALVKTAAYHPAFLQNLAAEGLTTMVSSRLRRRCKEILAVAISMTNGCKYCTTAHSTVLRKMFKLEIAEIVQIAALCAHFNGLAALEKALQIRADGSTGDLWQDACRQPVPEEISEAYSEVPVFYRILAMRSESLSLLWQRDRAVMNEGKFTEIERHLIGLGVAATRAADYGVGWHSRRLIELGLDRLDILEAIMVIDAFNKNSKFTEGMQLDLGVWKSSAE